MICVVCIGYLAWLIHWYQLVIAYQQLEYLNWWDPTLCYVVLIFLNVIGGGPRLNALHLGVSAVGQTALMRGAFMFFLCGVPLQSMYLALPLGLAAACFIADVVIDGTKDE